MNEGIDYNAFWQTAGSPPLDTYGEQVTGQERNLLLAYRRYQNARAWVGRSRDEEDRAGENAKRAVTERTAALAALKEFLPL